MIVCVHVCVCVCVFVCMGVYVRVYMQACVCTWVRAYVSVYIVIYMQRPSCCPQNGVKIFDGTPLPVFSEEDVFKYLDIPYQEPRDRDWD